jgi:tetraacyldisaccharide 4'-kinase
MDEAKVKDIMSGRGGVRDSLVRELLTMASVPYAAAMGIRRWGYRRGLFHSMAAAGGTGVAPARCSVSREGEQAEENHGRDVGATEETHGRDAHATDAHATTDHVPVISVGNITTGGTGKTPMVVWVVEHLCEAGSRPAILTRGYKSQEGVSDEAELLKAQTGVPVIVNSDRVAGAREAIAQGADVLVMDDGFQHRRLRRDLDIVLIDATNPFGYGFCLPRGLLREPLSALRDAHAIVITRSDAVFAEDLSKLRARLIRLAPQASISTAIHKPVCLMSGRGKKHSFESISGKSVFAFCGIGNPQSFFDTVKDLGAEMAAQMAFEDHVRYSPEVVASIVEKLADAKADFAVTTQKDLVKLPKVKLGKPILALAVEMEITADGVGLAAKIAHCVTRKT